MFEVTFTKKAKKSANLMPLAQQQRLIALGDDLRAKGPVLPNWPNFSKLGKDRYHCHLSHHWVACWEETVVGFKIEVYYVGSRESAPY
jgi:hypothetical protein